MEKQFERFLKEHRAWTAYNKNAVEFGDGITLDWLFVYREASGWLDGIFLFDDTDDRINWYDLNTKWHKICENGNN